MKIQGKRRTAPGSGREAVAGPRRVGALIAALLVGAAALLAVIAPGASATPTIGMMWSGDLALDGEEPTMEAIDRSGAEILRLHLSPVGSFGTYDTIFQHAWERGIRIYPYLVGRPNGGSPRLPAPSEWEPEGSAWETWLYEVVQRYGHGGSFWSGKSNPLPVVTWEIWNEPNAGWNNEDGSTVKPGYYAKFLKRSSQALSEAQAPHGTTVLFGGLLELGNSSTTMRPEDFIEEAHAAVSGLGSYYTALAHHPYVFKADDGGPPQNTTEVKQVRDKVRDSLEDVRGAMDNVGSGSKSIWVNELGWPVEHGDPGHPAVSESVQAELLGYCFNMMDNQSGGEDIFIGAMLYYNHRDIHVNAWDYAAGLRKDNGSSNTYTNTNFRISWDAFQEQTGASSWPVPANAATNNASNISYRSAKLNGQIDPNGLPTNYKFEWDTSESESYGNETSTENDWEDQTFSHSKTLTGLTPNTSYHYRIVSTNENAESDNGSDKSFKTLAAKPIVSGLGTSEPYVEDETGKVELEADINPNGFATTYHFEWADEEEFEAAEFNNSTPEVEMEYTGYAESKPVEVTIEGLTGPETYHYRVVAENSEGTTTSSEHTFETPDWRPEVSIDEFAGGGPYVSEETGKFDVVGEVDPKGFATKYHLRWGPDGGPYTDAAELELGSSTEAEEVEQTIEGLKGSTKYSYYLVAENANGKGYSYAYTVTTPDWSPDIWNVTTAGVGEETTLSAQVNSHGFATDYRFEWGLTDAYGDSVEGEAGSGTEYAEVDETVSTSLNEGYHFRVIAENAVGSTTGLDNTFTTVVLGLLEASKYPVTLEGTQIWEEEEYFTDNFIDLPDWTRWQCSPLQLAGEQIGKETWSELPMQVSPSECQAVYDTPLEMNGCSLDFKPSALSSGEDIVGTVAIGPPGCGPISMKIPTLADCYAQFPSQEGLAATFESDNSGPVATVIAELDSDTVDYREVGWSGGCNQFGEDARLKFKWELSGESPYDPVDIALTGQEYSTAAPSASTEDAIDVGPHGATLWGTVDPSFLPTDYSFEYVEDSEFEENGWENAAKAPVPPAEAGSGGNEIGVQETVKGLESSAIYHYRLVAENSKGSDTGSEMQLTTAEAHLPRFEAEEYPATISGEQDPEAKHTFDFFSDDYSCEEASFAGEMSEDSATLSLAPSYSECEGSATTASISTNGCEYALDAGEAVWGSDYLGSADIVCPEGEEIVIKGIFGICEVHVPPQTDLGGIVTYTNPDSNPQRVEAVFALFGLEYTEVDTAFCPFEEGEVTRYDGELGGGTTIGAENEAEEAIDLKVDGIELEEHDPRFEAQDYPATIAAAQDPEAPHTFDFASAEIACGQATMAGEMSESSETLGLAPSYSECENEEVVPWTIATNGCEYLLDAGETAEGGYAGTADIVCPEGEEIVAEGLEGICRVEIPPQSDLEAITYANPESSPQQVDTTFALSGLEYTEVDTSFCQFTETATRYDGEYTGGTTIEAENEAEETIGVRVHGN